MVHDYLSSEIYCLESSEMILIQHAGLNTQWCRHIVFIYKFQQITSGRFSFLGFKSFETVEL